MEERKIVVVVEEEEAARTALLWALHNMLRLGDTIILLHVFPHQHRHNHHHQSTTSRGRHKQLRHLRLKGYQLALSFKDICTSFFFNTKIEIIVTEDDEEGGRIVAVVREVAAFALIAGLHDGSFLYKLAVTYANVADAFNCRVLAIKQPQPQPQPQPQSQPQPQPLFLTGTGSTPPESSPRMDFSQIEFAALHVPDSPPPKIPYRICPSPYAIIWRTKKNRGR
ncbi:hypothetical protein Ancab_038736 [Ancistrocladus abbreviatus]